MQTIKQDTEYIYDGKNLTLMARKVINQGVIKMDFGNSKETTLTEKIMGRISEHLKQEPYPQENHHYNRVYEKIHAILKENP